MDRQVQTVKTYNQSAEALAEYFKGIGARTIDIERALRLAGAGKDARVVEVGCGDGRDAEQIVRRVAWYEGFDPSEGLLAIARKRLPDASFVAADALSYLYPDNLDVVYAFASLLHVGKTDMAAALAKIAAALRKGGIVYISLKECPVYQESLKQDRFGERMFYYYNPALVQELAGRAFTPVYENHQAIGHTDWFTIALKKN